MRGCCNPLNPFNILSHLLSPLICCINTTTTALSSEGFALIQTYIYMVEHSSTYSVSEAYTYRLTVLSLPLDCIMKSILVLPILFVLTCYSQTPSSLAACRCFSLRCRRTPRQTQVKGTSKDTAHVVCAIAVNLNDETVEGD